MNAKLCKKLRKATRNVTEGLPERRTAKLRRQSVNDPQTVRGVYRELKRSVSGFGENH